jgi:hypothetical protein
MLSDSWFHEPLSSLQGMGLSRTTRVASKFGLVSGFGVASKLGRNFKITQLFRNSELSRSYPVISKWSICLEIRQAFWNNAVASRLWGYLEPVFSFEMSLMCLYLLTRTLDTGPLGKADVGDKDRRQERRANDTLCQHGVEVREILSRRWNIRNIAENFSQRNRT